ncbi:MAG: PAS domain-containing protein [Deltaproteobacteria bacterium]|nr:PAS domain-containing protein [Deltaproteobacteria bacterium]
MASPAAVTPGDPIAQMDLAAIVEGLSCGVIARDAEGLIVYANPRVLTWLQYERDELVGQPLASLVPPEMRELALEETRAVEQGDLRARITVFRRKDSTTLPILAIPSVPESGCCAAFAIIIELAAIQTAKTAAESLSASLRASLEFALPSLSPDLRSVSAREREVLTLLVGGDRVPTIARRLEISPNTVRNHLKSMYRKLGVGSQSDLIERVRQIEMGG